MKKGIFCISIDHELLWGRKDLNYEWFIPKVKKEREIITKLLKLFKKYRIPATWAIVGKVFEKGDQLWYGADTIKEIKKQKDQEIGSHSYSHQVFTDISRKEAGQEISKNKSKSFVFPRNKVKYLKLLKSHGFKSYRGVDKRPWELFYPGIPPVYETIIKNQLVNIPGSFYFVSGRGLRKYIPQGLRYFKSKLGIDNAVKQRKIFHLWFHPIDFVDDSQKLFSDFEKVLKYADSKRKLGVLDIKTMEDIAKIK